MFDFLKSKKGDIRICKGRHGVLKEEDRFANMLIVGPQGSGKTSQAILPMIMQDIKNPTWGFTVMESHDDVALKACTLAHLHGRQAIYFDPTHDNCPKFNPLSGPEDDVVKNIVTVFKLMNLDSPQYYLDQNEKLLSNAVKVLKRLDKIEGVEGKYSTLICLERLLSNPDGWGMELVDTFHETYCLLAAKEIETCENQDIVHWFMTEYFQKDSKIYKDTSGIRAQIGELISNKFLRPVLNPDFRKGENYIIDFDKNLANGEIICISTALHELHELSRFLKYFLVLALQSSILNRPGTESTRRPHAVYIDDFPKFSTYEITDVLTYSHQLRVSIVLATRSRDRMHIGSSDDGTQFLEQIAKHVKNTILFPGISKDDAKYYAKQFGISVVDLFFGKTRKKEMNEVNYVIMKDSSLQPLRAGHVSFIPQKLNNKLFDLMLGYEVKHIIH